MTKYKCNIVKLFLDQTLETILQNEQQVARKARVQLHMILFVLTENKSSS